MPLIANDDSFTWAINTTEQSNPAFGTELNTNEHGFMAEPYLPERVIEPREGYFDGIPPVDDLERYENTDITFKVYLNDTTKALVDKDGQYFQFQHQMRDGTTPVITYVCKARVKRSQPDKDNVGRLTIDFMATIYDIVTTVA